MLRWQAWAAATAPLLLAVVLAPAVSSAQACPAMTEPMPAPVVSGAFDDGYGGMRWFTGEAGHTTYVLAAAGGSVGMWVYVPVAGGCRSECTVSTGPFGGRVACEAPQGPHVVAVGPRSAVAPLVPYVLVRA